MQHDAAYANSGTYQNIGDDRLVQPTSGSHQSHNDQSQYLEVVDRSHTLNLQILCPYHVYGGTADCPMFKRVSDVRQHIRRKHLQIPLCPTCGVTFDRDPGRRRLEQNIQQASCIPLQDPFRYPGATWDECLSILDRAGDRGRHSPVQRWNKIREILFPDTEFTEDIYIQVTGTEFSMRLHHFIILYLHSPMMQTSVTTRLFPQANESNPSATGSILHGILEDFHAFVETEDTRSQSERGRPHNHYCTTLLGGDGGLQNHNARSLSIPSPQLPLIPWSISPHDLLLYGSMDMLSLGIPTYPLTLYNEDISTLLDGEKYGLNNQRW